MGREGFLSRRASPKVILLDDDASGIVPTDNRCDLLCPSCAEVYLVAGMIRIEELYAMSYGEYLRGLEWQKIREKKLDQAGRYCHACGRVYILEVHHNRYTDVGDEDLTHLFVFCRTCHSRYHGIRREAA